MVAAIHYYATPADQAELLDYLGEPDEVSLHPWPVVGSPPVVLSRDQALATGQVMVVHRDLGPPSVIRPGSPAMAESTKAGVFNRINWDQLRPKTAEALVDSNASTCSPLDTRRVERVRASGMQHWVAGRCHGSNLGRVRAMGEPGHGWIRRKGTKVWGLEGSRLRPDLDVDLPHVSTVCALPDALANLERGVPGR